ncbi:MAG: hypothetical protein ACMUJM_03065 [bacterium]
MTEYDQILSNSHYDAKEAEVILVQLLKLAEADGVFDESEKMMIRGLIKKHEFRYSHFDDILSDKNKELDFSVVRHPEHMILYMIMLAYCDGKLSDEEWIQIKEIAYIMAIDDNRLDQLHTIVRHKLYTTILGQLSMLKVQHEIKTRFLSEVKNCLSLSGRPI